MAEEKQSKGVKETEQAKESEEAKTAKKWSSETKKLGDKIVALTLMQAKELGDYLKDCRWRTCRYGGRSRAGC
jgi:hypothetical protein